MSRVSDEHLLSLAIDGSQDAVSILFDRYHRLVFDVAIRIVRDPGEAEDVVQNVFLAVFRAMAKFDSEKGTLRVWLLQYAYHRALHKRRHLVSRQFYRWENIEAAIERGAGRGPWGEISEATRLAQQLLETLKPHQREVLELTYYEGLTAEEIARRLDQSAHAIRHHLRRGIARLRKAFGRQ